MQQMDVDIHPSSNNRNSNTLRSHNRLSADVPDAINTSVSLSFIRSSTGNTASSQTDGLRNDNVPGVHETDLSSPTPLTGTGVSALIHSVSISKSGVDQQSNDRLLYTTDHHSSKCLDHMNRLRKNKELCDVVLLVDGREICAHRVLLAACSAYFRAMFTGELAESRQTQVTLYDLDGDAVETLIDFCYTSQITVEGCNVQNLLPAACLLQLTEIQDVCCEFLKRQLDPSNCLGIRAFADTHACRGLLRVAHRFTQLNFLEVIESEEFLLLPVNHLVDIVCSDELNVHSEEQVYWAVMRWIHHDLSDRRRYLSYLLQHVRLPLMSPKFLVGTVSTDLLIRSDEHCRDLLDEAKDYLLLPQERPLMQGPRTKPRKMLQTGELLFAVGGWCSGDAIASAEQYDPMTHKWQLVAPMHKRRCGVGVGVVNDLLYAVGGHDGQSYLNSVERYDPHTNHWSSDVAPTSTCRTSVGVAVLNGSMYAVGGQDGTSSLNLVERYDANVNRWLKVTNMNSRRLGVGVIVLNGQLYAIGGSDGQLPLCSVERYDPRVGSWQFVTSMITRRKHLGVTVYNGLIYAVGGRDELTELSSAECLDLRTHLWSPVVAMTSRRSGVGLAVINNQLIAIGGFDGVTYLKTVELYDPDANCWSLCGSMNYRRLGGGVGVVRLTDTIVNTFISNNPHQHPVYAQILNNSIHHHHPHHHRHRHRQHEELVDDDEDDDVEQEEQDTEEPDEFYPSCSLNTTNHLNLNTLPRPKSTNTNINCSSSVVGSHSTTSLPPPPPGLSMSMMINNSTTRRRPTTSRNVNGSLIHPSYHQTAHIGDNSFPPSNNSATATTNNNNNNTTTSSNNNTNNCNNLTSGGGGGCASNSSSSSSSSSTNSCDNNNNNNTNDNTNVVVCPSTSTLTQNGQQPQQHSRSHSKHNS